MQNTVSERGCGDHAFFGIAYQDGNVIAGAVGLGVEFVFEADEFFLEIGEE